MVSGQALLLLISKAEVENPKLRTVRFQRNVKEGLLIQAERAWFEVRTGVTMLHPLHSGLMVLVHERLPLALAHQQLFPIQLVLPGGYDSGIQHGRVVLLLLALPKSPSCSGVAAPADVIHNLDTALFQY